LKNRFFAEDEVHIFTKTEKASLQKQAKRT